MSGTVVPFAAPGTVCAIPAGESYSAHARRCGCDFAVTTWAALADRVRSREENRPLGGSPSVAAAQIADATAEAFAALNRVIRLADDIRNDLMSRSGDAGLHQLGVELVQFMVEADYLTVRGADARRVLNDILAECDSA